MGIKNLVILYQPVCVWESPGQSVHSAACGSASGLSLVAVRDKMTPNIRRREYTKIKDQTTRPHEWGTGVSVSSNTFVFKTKIYSTVYKLLQSWSFKLKYSKFELPFKFCMVVIKAFGQTFTRSDPTWPQNALEIQARCLQVKAW